MEDASTRAARDVHKLLRALWGGRSSMDRLRVLWQKLRESLWLVPTLMVAFSAAAAAGLVYLESSKLNPEIFAKYPWLLGAGADGARGLLEAIAASVITVAGVTFSVLVVALSLSSSQYTPRVLRNFTASRATQGVLGFFVSIYAYCLIVLRMIDKDSVPRLAVFGALLFALAGTAVLIFFIHHVAESVQASHILVEISDETRDAIDRLFPEELGDELEPVDALSPELRRVLEQACFSPVVSKESGYIEGVDNEGLVDLGQQRGLIVRMERAIGEFVAEGMPIASIASYGSPTDELEVDDALSKEINALYSIGPYRTITQDAAFGLSQIVDVAVKSLSPAVNAPAVAMMCLDRLGSLLLHLAERRIPSPYRVGEERLCVIAAALDFASYLELSYGPILTYAAYNVSIYESMLFSLRIAAMGARSVGRRRVFAAWAARVVDMAERELRLERERERIRAASALLVSTLMRARERQAADTEGPHVPH